MTIAEARTSCKNTLARVPREFLVVSIIILASLASFGLGFLAGANGQGSVVIEQLPTASSGGEVVASRNGTKYFLPWCAGAKNISSANLITFASTEDAQAQGYSPAANCKGL